MLQTWLYVIGNFEIEPAIAPIFNMPIGTDITLINKDGKKFFIYTATGELVRLKKHLYF